MVVAIAADGYRSNYPAEYLRAHHPVLVLTVDGKPTHVIGVPLHWGFTGQARKGYGANTLTPSVGDANTQTPEFKAFLVNVEPTSAPVA